MIDISKRVGLINVNGKEYFVDDEHTFEPVIEALGITKEDIAAWLYDYLYENLIDEIIADMGSNGGSSLYGARYDGLIGDSWFKFLDGLRAEVNDLENDIYESLLAPSRKGNTKADIAARLKTIIDNLNYQI